MEDIGDVRPLRPPADQQERGAVGELPLPVGGGIKIKIRIRIKIRTGKVNIKGAPFVFRS
jgi:hypothetical protein